MAGHFDSATKGNSMEKEPHKKSKSDDCVGSRSWETAHLPGGNLIDFSGDCKDDNTKNHTEENWSQHEENTPPNTGTMATKECSGRSKAQKSKLDEDKSLSISHDSASNYVVHSRSQHNAKTIKNEESKSTTRRSESGTSRAAKAQNSPLPEARNAGSRRNILIIGSANAGKYAIAKNVATEDGTNFPEQEEIKGAGQVHRYNFGNYKFFLIDTAGAQLQQQGHNNPRASASAIRSQIELNLDHGINLIIAVVRKDCCTPEEINSLVHIIENLFSTEAREYIALVHSGCENLQPIERKKYMELFQKGNGPAANLSSLCHKGTLAVGFPNLEEVKSSYMELYQESIAASKEALRKLVKNSRNIQPHIELFKTRKFEMFHQVNLFQSSSNPDCALM